MEKTLSADERIKKAEELYYKKKVLSNYKNNTKVNLNEKKEIGLFKKMFLQIIICVIIYAIFYMIQNTNYIFSDDVINKANQILSYDINVENLYTHAKKYIDSYISNIKDNVEEIKEETNEQINEVNNEQEYIEEQQNIEETESIGGEEPQTVEEPLSQMEKDAKDILETISLVIPLKGTITSRYGLREPSIPTVPKNHTGIDIAVNEGTIFNSAMNGVVTLVSSEGDLGNHIKIEEGDIATVYAHCKTIYVNEGDVVLQGQNLGEVGQTGNATGPHLHFEVKKDNRYVDPDLVLNFE